MQSSNQPPPLPPVQPPQLHPSTQSLQQQQLMFSQQVAQINQSTIDLGPTVSANILGTTPSSSSSSSSSAAAASSSSVNAFASLPHPSSLAAITSHSNPVLFNLMSPAVPPIMSPSTAVFSPQASPMDSPIASPRSGPNNSVWTNFVHKLYGMVADKMYQHLISWNYSGTSFIVCNVLEFARDVLPKHFKHNNFSSFVRQLNMYGFHKVNKSPRGSRTLAENQVWEFSHPKFLRDHPELLEEIKRRTIESDAQRRENSDL
ncbi:hypothetical protein HK405_014546, partial [Cladochytrium tenue]